MPGTNKPDIAVWAVKLLGRRDHSEKELFLKLKKRGYAEAEIAPALSRLRQEGLLDDTRYARRRLDYFRENKPLGRARVVGELAGRGVDLTLARELVDREYPREEEAVLLYRLALKQVRKLGVGDFGEALSRVGPFLARRGFGGEDIAVALEKVLREEDLEELPSG